MPVCACVCVCMCVGVRVRVCVRAGVKLGHLIVSMPLDVTSSWTPSTARSLRTPENTVTVQQSLSPYSIIYRCIHILLLVLLLFYTRLLHPFRAARTGVYHSFASNGHYQVVKADSGWEWLNLSEATGA